MTTRGKTTTRIKMKRKIKDASRREKGRGGVKGGGERGLELRERKKKARGNENEREKKEPEREHGEEGKGGRGK